MVYPTAESDERELLLNWLAFLRRSIVDKLQGLDEDQARWRPDGKLLPIAGVVFHLTEVEDRWIEAAFLGEDSAPPQDDEFVVHRSLTVEELIDRYRRRGARTDDVVRSATAPTDRCRRAWAKDGGLDLRWVLVHLIEETARHAGHASASGPGRRA